MQDRPDPVRREMTRRTFLARTIAGGTAVVLSGCGGSSTRLGSNPTSRLQTITLNLDTTPVAVENGRNVNYVASYTGNRLQSAFWGTQQTDGTANQIMQALVWDTNADQGVRVEFDGRGLPTRIVDEVTSAFVTCFWETNRAVFKFYQPSGIYIGGVSVTGTAPSFELKQLTDSATVGLFVGRLTGATDGIFSINVGGVETKAAQTARRRGARNKASGVAAAVPSQVVPALTRLEQITSTSNYPPGTKELIQAFSTEYLSTGQSLLFARITTTALQGTGLSGTFIDNGLSIVRGIISAAALQQAVTQFLSQTNAGEDLVQKEIIRFEFTSPGLTGFVSTVSFPIPQPTDKTAISGVMVSREFGSIPIRGVIDSSEKFSANGSLDGVVVTMTGSVSGSKVTGQWTSSTGAQNALGGSNKSSRPQAGGAKAAAVVKAAGGGNFDGNEQPLGQCQTQQNSGGQGTFTNTYDLQRCGTFSFSYQAYSIPDHIRVLNGDQTIFDTGGPVSGGTTVSLHASAASTLITVIVIASLDGTAWDYTVGCPTSAARAALVAAGASSSCCTGSEEPDSGTTRSADRRKKEKG